MPPTLLILEDDPDRVVRFSAALRASQLGLTLQIYQTAPEMMRAIPRALTDAAAISLDHDLMAPPGDPDPGDGLQVAEFLVSQPVIRPVIVHSSNGPRAAMMMERFAHARWPHTRVPPIGADWIETDWITQLSRLLTP